MVLDMLSQFVQLDVAQFMDDETGSLAEDHRVFWVFSNLPDLISCMSLSSLSGTFWDFAHSLFILQDYIVSNSFNSEVDFKFRLFFDR